MTKKRPNARFGSRYVKNEFDWELFKKLCEIHCTKAEICNVMNFDEKTVTARCKEVYQKSYLEVWEIFATEGKRSLRAAQLQKALSGNVPMMIWLGKQWLGQKEPSDDDLKKAISEIKVVLHPDTIPKHADNSQVGLCT